MCEENDTVSVRVKIQADLSCDGKEHWTDAQIDRCIAPLVQALQRGGIDMRSSCCGHGTYVGRIDLQDGRCLVILNEEQTEHLVTYDELPCRLLLNKGMPHARKHPVQLRVSSSMSYGL